MRLQEEIIKDHFVQYEKLIAEYQPILLRGLQILNRILKFINRPDIIWLVKLNIELARILEDQGERGTSH